MMKKAAPAGAATANKHREGLMYSIEKKDYGIKLVFDGFIRADEMQKWVEESKSKLLSFGLKAFGVFVDMRTLKPLPQDAQVVMTTGQKLYKEAGMTRSVVILNDPIVTMQFRRLAKTSGIYEWERYIDASTVTDWEAKGEAWLKDSADPDK
jgi:hypothetical protein